MIHLSEFDPRFEFLSVERFCRGLGIDWGCGSNRFAPTVLSVDNYPHKEADIVIDISHDKLPFVDNVFDFVFSSHAIEDVEPQYSQKVFDELGRVIKVGGYMALLIPDMERHRYPYFDELFGWNDPEVMCGERTAGELKGNPGHKYNAGLTCLNEWVNNSKYKWEIVQSDTLEHSQMTLDFVIKKL
jgi:SAM-dependent methyltransferase